jgi:putative aminopeptidase FrvX
MDSIYCEADLQCLTSDLNHHIALDADLAERCVRIAGACGSPMRLARMKFGGGATDAAELARAGVKATTLLAMSTDVVRDGLVYHTTRDTVEAIDPAAVEACLKIAVNLAYELDQEA